LQSWAAVAKLRVGFNKGMIMMTRREALQTTALITAGVVIAGPATSTARAQAAAAAPTGPHKLPALPYPFDALEPHIDAQTMQIHHDKHHQTYVTNLNKALVGHDDLAKKPVQDLVRDLSRVPEDIRTAVRNSGGGHYNHSLFWQMLKKGGGGEPKGALKKAIDDKFGSFDKFKEEFTAAATKVFGSGWAWLTLDGKQLKVESSPNQDNPLTQGRLALLGIDVWEHAYYLKYQNRRPDYIAAFYNVINWDFVTERFQQAGQG
jgi:Fe-Mn family superoxide dismutase